MSFCCSPERNGPRSCVVFLDSIVRLGLAHDEPISQLQCLRTRSLICPRFANNTVATGAYVLHFHLSFHGEALQVVRSCVPSFSVLVSWYTNQKSNAGVRISDELAHLLSANQAVPLRLRHPLLQCLGLGLVQYLHLALIVSRFDHRLVGYVSCVMFPDLWHPLDSPRPLCRPPCHNAFHADWDIQFVKWLGSCLAIVGAVHLASEGGIIAFLLF